MDAPPSWPNIVATELWEISKKVFKRILKGTNGTQWDQVRENLGSTGSCLEKGVQHGLKKKTESIDAMGFCWEGLIGINYKRYVSISYWMLHAYYLSSEKNNQNGGASLPTRTYGVPPWSQCNSQVTVSVTVYLGAPGRTALAYWLSHI